MGKSVCIIFPNQLFKKTPFFGFVKKIVLVESPRFFKDFNFHKQKIHFHRSSMLGYAAYLRKKKYDVVYVTYDCYEEYFDQLTGVSDIHYIDTVDDFLEKWIKKYALDRNIKLHKYDSPSFFLGMNDVKKIISGKKRLFFHSFYIQQRKRLKILVDKNNEPLGGLWSYDKQNRLPLPSDADIPVLKKIRMNTYMSEAVTYVKKNFSDNPGELHANIYPITHIQAERWLDDFLKQRLPFFGPYEDAFHAKYDVLYHSVLSPLLNSGLLTPDYVIAKTLKYTEKNHIPLPSLEAFVRQIIGWREYMRVVYIAYGDDQRVMNFLEHKRKISKSMWYGTTGITPFDDTVKKILRSAYAHHIERLMVLGNIFLLCEVHPDDVYMWFMTLFIDAYDWVMVPNIYGMSQYADGGLITTKPYFCGSAYIKRMSDYKSGYWSDVWDALYWCFVDTHQEILEKNFRTKIIVQSLRRLSCIKLAGYKKIKKSFLKDL